jgi:hypothetical protein
MSKLNSRIKQVAEGLLGNESLLEMVEGSAASELLAWGLDLSKSIVKATTHLGDEEAQAAMGPRLEALRQLLRLVGNWAAGKYAEPAARVQLRDQLLEQFGMIWGGEGSPTAEQLDALLEQAETGDRDAHQRISILRAAIENLFPGGPRVKA